MTTFSLGEDDELAKRAPDPLGWQVDVRSDVVVTTDSEAEGTVAGADRDSEGPTPPTKDRPPQLAYRCSTASVLFPSSTR